MADKGHQAIAHTDEERQRQSAKESGHSSHEKGAAHEFNDKGVDDAGRRGGPAHTPIHASQENPQEPLVDEGDSSEEEPSEASPSRSRKTRGGTHDQHVTAGKKGGSRIRELIELGYKYEEEHGIGPGRNERSKLAAKRKLSKPEDEESGDEPA
jgi:hypothetical protein